MDFRKNFFVWIAIQVYVVAVCSECPEDYIPFENSCYKIYSSMVSRDAASRACTAANSHLVDITSQEEQDFLAGKLDSQGSGDAWIGLSSQNISGPLYWTDGSPLDFEAWTFVGRNDGGTCIRMSAWTGKWGDRPCDTKYRFVCEFEKNNCTLGTDNCDVNATCTATVDSFTCACNAGYSGDGVTCTG
ncbi:snaclec purpureotin subunit beta-like [Amphiura filiformis]|uniref:snaclec purpureotin subunit beta-like n=1 Tax=Amphiura filiformis TaxID=82378 RepID=UPI003B20C81B